MAKDEIPEDGSRNSDPSASSELEEDGGQETQGLPLSVSAQVDAAHNEDGEDKLGDSNENEKEGGAADLTAGKTDPGNSAETSTWTWAVVVALLLGLLTFVLSKGAGDLEIVAVRVPTDSGGVQIGGRVLFKNEFLEGVQVWAIGNQVTGEQYLSEIVKTDEEGKFDLLVQGSEGGSSTKGRPQFDKIDVHARSPGWAWNTGFQVKTKSNVLSSSKNVHEKIASGNPIGYTLLLCFGSSILVAFVALRKKAWRSKAYHCTVLLALVLSGGMVYYVGYNLNAISDIEDDKIIELGFANIYRGTYSHEVPDSWLFSLTEPPFRTGIGRETLDGDNSSETENPNDPEPAGRESNSPSGDGEDGGGADRKTAATGSAPDKGFGAPVWVIFLSVVGAALFTVSLIVKEIKNPVDFEQDEDFKIRLHEIIQHQFFIIFSPLGGVFLYQALVIAGAVSEPATVAIAALGAGVSLNLVLARAVASFEKGMEKSISDPPPENRSTSS